MGQITGRAGDDADRAASAGLAPAHPAAGPGGEYRADRHPERVRQGAAGDQAARPHHPCAVPGTRPQHPAGRDGGPHRDRGRQHLPARPGTGSGPRPGQWHGRAPGRPPRPARPARPGRGSARRLPAGAAPGIRRRGPGPGARAQASRWHAHPPDARARGARHRERQRQRQRADHAAGPGDGIPGAAPAARTRRVPPGGPGPGRLTRHRPVRPAGQPPAPLRRRRCRCPARPGRPRPG